MPRGATRAGPNGPPLPAADRLSLTGLASLVNPANVAPGVDLDKAEDDFIGGALGAEVVQADTAPNARLQSELESIGRSLGINFGSGGAPDLEDLIVSREPDPEPEPPRERRPSRDEHRPLREEQRSSRDERRPLRDEQRSSRDERRPSRDSIYPRPVDSRADEVAAMIEMLGAKGSRSRSASVSEAAYSEAEADETDDETEGSDASSQSGRSDRSRRSDRSDRSRRSDRSDRSRRSERSDRSDRSRDSKSSDARKRNRRDEEARRREVDDLLNQFYGKELGILPSGARAKPAPPPASRLYSTREHESNARINNAIESLQATAGKGLTEERRSEEIAGKLDMIQDLITALDEEGDKSYKNLRIPTEDSPLSEINTCLSRLQFRVNRTRYASIGHELIVAAAEMLEAFLDGTKEIPILGAVDYTGLGRVIDYKLTRERNTLASLVGNAVSDHGVNPTASLLLVLVPTLLLHPRARARSRGARTPGLADVMDAAPAPAYAETKQSMLELSRAVDDI